VSEACDPDRKRNVAVIFDDLSDELCRVADMAEFVRLAHPDPAMATAAQDSCIAISGLVEQLNTHRGIYSALNTAVKEGDRFQETEVDKHVARLFLLDFRLCGIHLDDADRESVVRLNDRILRAGQEFAAGCQQPRAVKASLLPESIRSHFHTEGGSVVVSGHSADSPSDLAREAAYKIYYWREPRQEKILLDMLEDRHNLAQLCGYKTFRHRAVTNSLAETPGNIDKFLATIARELPSRVKNDHDTMWTMKKRANPLAQSLSMWDVGYFSQQARTSWFDLDIEKISEYFSLGVAMEGLNDIFQSLFGVEMVVETAEEGELWSEDVYKMAVIDTELNKVLGHIYCDFFSRPGKPHQDCHFTIRGGRCRYDGTYQDPVVVLMLNLPPPGWRTPTLLSPSSLDNLFHEMGHALHSMLGRTKYQHVTGTRCSTDFAEVPSTLMEYFASDPRVLGRLNKHYKTGESLPSHVIEKYCATKKIFAGVELQAQLFYSALDQVYHDNLPLDGDPTAVLEKVQGDYHTLPYVPGTAYQLRFSHLVGYGARYYSYLLARAVASAMWQQHFMHDPYSREAGRRYREECLSHGGGKRSQELVNDFLGRDIKPAELATSLIDELDTKIEVVEQTIRSK